MILASRAKVPGIIPGAALLTRIYRSSMARVFVSMTYQVSPFQFRGYGRCLICVAVRWVAIASFAAPLYLTRKFEQFARPRRHQTHSGFHHGILSAKKARPEGRVARRLRGRVRRAGRGAEAAASGGCGLRGERAADEDATGRREHGAHRVRGAESADVCRA